MGKSVRSKSMRANRATRRTLIHAPNEDKRLARLTNLGKVESLVAHVVLKYVEEEVETEDVTMDKGDVVLTKDEKQRLFMSRNQYKRKVRAKSLSKMNKRK